MKDNFVSWSGTAGDAVADSGKKAADFAAATHDHAGKYEPSDSKIQEHLKITTANPGNPHGTTKTHIGLGNVTNEAQIAKSIGTAKGSLIAYSENNKPEEFKVGEKNQVLTADPTSSTGLSWKSPTTSQEQKVYWLNHFGFLSSYGATHIGTTDNFIGTISKLYPGHTK